MFEKIYDGMIDNDEMWYVFPNGNAVIIMDLPIWDS